MANAKKPGTKKPKAVKPRAKNKPKQSKKATSASQSKTEDTGVFITVKTGSKPAVPEATTKPDATTAVPAVPTDQPAIVVEAVAASPLPDKSLDEAAVPIEKLPDLEVQPVEPESVKTLAAEESASEPDEHAAQPAASPDTESPELTEPAAVASETKSLGQPPNSQPPTGLSIQINIGAFKRPSLHRLKKPWAKLHPYLVRLRPYLTKRRLITGAVVATALIITLSVIHSGSVRHRNQTAAQAVSAGQATEAKPTFKPVVPAAHPGLSIPGPYSRFDPSHGSYSFIDSISGNEFTVSEQHLSSSTAAQSALGRAAQSLNATHQIKTKSGTAYLVTIQKYNSQELVFSVDKLLCFIQSSNLLTDDQWVGYINALR